MKGEGALDTSLVRMGVSHTISNQLSTTIKRSEDESFRDFVEPSLDYFLHFNVPTMREDQ